MTHDDIKKNVRERYARFAIERTSCCGPACGCDTTDEQLLSTSMRDQYVAVDQQILAAADLGLGCGTPTAFAEITEGMTVLDLGSGAGIDVFIAAKQTGPKGKAIGIDMTDEMIQRANTNKTKLGIANAEFRKGEIENLPVESESVDKVLSNCVINLVPNKTRAFSEIYRVLKSGGTFVVSDIVSVGDIPNEIRGDMELWAGCIAGSLEKQEYMRVIENAGFRNVEILSERPYQLDANVPFGLRSITVRGMK